jgi:hypothetical protein
MTCQWQLLFLMGKKIWNEYDIRNDSVPVRKGQGRPNVTNDDVSMGQEIECPRCHGVMTLYFEFDILGYFEEYDFA